MTPVFLRNATTPGSAYLVRPDGHVAARFKHLDSVDARARLQAALARAWGRA